MKLSTFDSHGQPLLDTWQGLSLIPTAPPDVPKSVRLEGSHVRVSVFGSPGEIRGPPSIYQECGKFVESAWVADVLYDDSVALFRRSFRILTHRGSRSRIESSGSRLMVSEFQG